MIPKTIPAPATLAMLGGGQLGRFFVTAAHELGYKVIVLDPDADAPAGLIADDHIIAAYDDPAALEQLANRCAAATTEFENVPAAALEKLAEKIPVHPSAEAVAIAQNRIAEKTFLGNNGFATAPFMVIEKAPDLAKVSDEMFPAILKIARFGYDGKGQARVKNISEAQQAFTEFNAPCVLEKMVKLDLEVSVVLARNSSGECQSFTLTENQHSHGILDISIAPARTSATLLAKAEEMAKQVAQHLNYVGVLAVEFFIVNGELLINEVAPRPHNSGHYTLDGCVTHQFEQQVRALCNLPLGTPRLHSASVMVNLLGDLWFQENSDESREPDWAKLNNIPNLKLHLYGKE
ncbi:MAG: 5-(carboxyamino)imidazole ribonucleotide synthase, partial [Pseudomonas sp.]|nr:5-(carboxyamino)imidazole ribonucleotide synthase [Pseudomonas sp.]